MLSYSHPLGGGFRFRTRNPLVLVVLLSVAVCWWTLRVMVWAVRVTAVLTWRLAPAMVELVRRARRGRRS